MTAGHSGQHPVAVTLMPAFLRSSGRKVVSPAAPTRSAKGKRWLLGGSPVIESVPTPSILLRWGNCTTILDRNVSLFWDTPGLHVVVVAARPCHCGTSARTVVRFGGTDA